MNVAVELPDDVVEAIAQRAAEIVLERQAAAVPARSKYASIDEAKDFLRCGKQRIYDLRSSRTLTPFTEGGRALVAWSELEALVEVEGLEQARRAA